MFQVKSVLIAITLCICSFHVFSQRYFIQPYLGYGITGITGFSNVPDNFFRNKRATTAGINFGRTFGRFQLSAGVAALNTGFRHKSLLVTSLSAPNGDTADMIVTHTHLMLQIMAGYNLFEKNGFSITPAIAICPAYISRSKSTWKFYSGAEVVEDYISQPGNPFPRTSLIGSGSLKLSYELNKRIAVTLTPTYYITINPMLQNNGAGSRDYAFTGNVGISLAL